MKSRGVTRVAEWTFVNFERVLLSAGDVYLRPPRLKDHAAWARVRDESREFLQPWEPAWPAGDLGRAAFRRRVRAWRSQAQEGTGYSLFIFRRSDDAFLGGCRIFEMRQAQQAASVAYWVGASYARRGYMFAAMSQVVHLSFNKLNLHRLEATCEPQNEASRRLLLKLGFHEEGRVRGLRHVRSAWRDMILFGLLADDPWQHRLSGLAPKAETTAVDAPSREPCGAGYDWRV